jgi:succinate-semialdehyde dehydrogenase
MTSLSTAPHPADRAPAAISRNPATEALIGRYPFDDANQLEALLQASERAFRAWRGWSVERRATLLSALGEALLVEEEPLAALVTAEMGKTIGEARAEIRKCARHAAWYAEHGAPFLADEPAPLEGGTAYVSFLPVGTVLGIMPWNFPFWQVLRAAVPVLLAGNAFMLKHAPNVMGCAYALRDLFERCGFPPGVFNVANVGNEAVEFMIRDRRIAGVSLTGSVRAGAAVAAAAGREIKKSLLELGGSDPFIVLADADLDRAVEVAVTARYQNAGQVCLAAKRFILEAPIADAFTERFIAASRTLVVGDPMQDGTRLGPMARDDLRHELHGQVERSVAGGAQLLLGGGIPDGPGYFYPPTVLGNVGPGNVAFEQETFGPVAALVVARDAEEAVALANRSEYGLSSSVWTRDLDLARRIARQLETGGVFVNGFSASDPAIPVGGVKKSGYGRELSHFGVREFTNAQTVRLA